VVSIVTRSTENGAQRPEALDLAAGALHLLAKAPRASPARHRVESTLNLDAPSNVGQRPGRYSWSSRPRDVLGVVDGATRAAIKAIFAGKTLRRSIGISTRLPPNDGGARVRASVGRERRLLDVERRQLE